MIKKYWQNAREICLIRFDKSKLFFGWIMNWTAKIEKLTIGEGKFSNYLTLLKEADFQKGQKQNLFHQFRLNWHLRSHGKGHLLRTGYSKRCISHAFGGRLYKHAFFIRKAAGFCWFNIPFKIQIRSTLLAFTFHGAGYFSLDPGTFETVNWSIKPVFGFPQNAFLPAQLNSNANKYKETLSRKNIVAVCFFISCAFFLFWIWKKKCILYFNF